MWGEIGEVFVLSGRVRSGVRRMQWGETLLSELCPEEGVHVMVWWRECDGEDPRSQVALWASLPNN